MQTEHEKIVNRLVGAGFDSEAESHLLRVLALELQLTESNLVGPISPGESPIVTVDLSEKQMLWMNRRFPHGTTFGMEVGKIESDLIVLASLWTRSAMFVIIGEKKDGFICWIWRSSKDGVLRICSPHLTDIASSIEAESVRATTPRKGARAAG